ncbi:MAG TPA: hypothetical protein VFI92_02695 [Steroidobacteraceae bacterium]|nr:hypothetical protein [Steroidobacteraceae bacterium]
MSEADKPLHRLWATLRSHLGLGRRALAGAIDTPETLARFLDERASFVAQTSLYGYLQARAGMRYPALFHDDPFVESINVAKWHLWLDCLSDLAVYAGSRLAHHTPDETPRIARMMVAVVEDVLAGAGIPAEAGRGFAAHAANVRRRVADTDWLAVGPDESAFTESPAGLLRWAPVKDELKALDEEIVRNSVRFRWQEVRREFARQIEPRAVVDRISR